MTETTLCPESALLESYRRGVLAPERVRGLHRHLAQCERCAARFREFVVDPPPTRSTDFAFLKPPQGTDELGRIGAYRVLEVLGKGGMGVVFRAENRLLERTVALKVLRADLRSSAESRARFLREARALAALKNDHVVALHEVGEEDDVIFLAMEHLEGETLQTYLDRRRRLPATEIVRLARQLASGLAAVHALGLVHRDIKPNNVFLTERKAAANEGPYLVKLLDFGLVRPDEGHEQLTDPGIAMGTPGYLSPEQARGKAVDLRTDLFALGCILYRAATGRLPYEGPSTLAYLSSLATDVPTPVGDFAPDMPARLARLIDRLLARRPGERPGSARWVLQELIAIERGEHDEDTPVVGVHRKRIRTAAGALPWLIAAGSLLLALGAGVAAWILLRTPGAAVAEAGMPPVLDFAEVPADLREEHARLLEQARNAADAATKQQARRSLLDFGQRIQAMEKARPLAERAIEDGNALVRPRLRGAAEIDGDGMFLAVPGGNDVVFAPLLSGFLRLSRRPERFAPPPIPDVFAARADGKRLLLPGPDGPGHLLLWDAERGGPSAQWHVAGPPPRGGVFSPGGDLLVVISDKTRMLTPGSKTPTLLPGPPPTAEPVFSKDGRWLYGACEGGCVIRWNVTAATGDRKWTLGIGRLGAVALSPDETALAVQFQDDGEVHLFDLAEGKITSRLRGHGGALGGHLGGAHDLPRAGGPPPMWMSIDFSPDGSLVATGDTGGAWRIFDRGSGALLHEQFGDGLPVDVRFLEEGRALAVYRRGLGPLQAWDIFGMR